MKKKRLLLLYTQKRQKWEKKYYAKNVLSNLKKVVEADELEEVHTLIKVGTACNLGFFYCNYAENSVACWNLLYPNEVLAKMPKNYDCIGYIKPDDIKEDWKELLRTDGD